MSVALADVQVQDETVADVEPMTWEVRLGDGQPQRRLIVFAIALAAGLIGILLLHQVIFGIVGSLAILFSTSEMFLPIRYRLDQSGASAKVGLSRSEILWPSVLRVVEHENEVKLSPLADPSSRLDPFRGVVLRFDGNRDEVLAKIRQLRGDL